MIASSHKIQPLDERLAPLLYVLNSAGKLNRHKLFKILYFADQKHLKKYGRLITKDNYSKMPDGPVPSENYDIVKIAAGKDDSWYSEEFQQQVRACVKCDGPKDVYAISKANMQFLAKSELAALDESIKENINLDYKTLREKSHDSAWKSAVLNRNIPLAKIAEAAGADPKMMKYVS